ncbi:uncharacterized protein LOC143285639 [Babylonia areolata]|uniref:uncharacterized protein LOC143285639 n=1 Tax=Babylonia areolata TaxID=304850 RepID=UPI003FD23014
MSAAAVTTRPTAPFLNKSHNFGIFLKKGKRGILQLDFPSQMILLIQRGHIKKTQHFHSLLYFESESEDLHVSMRFLDGDVEFEADTSEEKFTICRLLNLILEAENAEPVRMVSAGEVGVVPRVPLVPQTVLKDGVLEKKGNTTITTWNRRRVKISAGEFSYFKPGEELALNVVQLRQDRCVIQRVGQNSIHLSVNQRSYCFRVPNDSRGGLSVETVREDWVKAFEQATTMKRAVSLYSTTSPLSPEEEEAGHQGDTETASDVSSADGSPFVNRKAPTESFTQSLAESGKPEITASVSVHFSYKNSNNNNNNSNSNHTISSIDPATSTTTTTFVNPQPPRPTKRATVYPFRRHKDKAPDRRGSGGSEVVSRPHPDSLSDDLPVTALRANVGENDARILAKRDVSDQPAPPTTTTTTTMEARGRIRRRVVMVVAVAVGGEGVVLAKVAVAKVTPSVKAVSKLSVSLWSEGKAHVPTFDLTLLEAMFSVCEREVAAVHTSKAVRRTLVDPKRAQNLGILFSGFKADSVAQVMAALSSVSEMDCFPLQKMATLKRFQPTAEDVEMFKMYRQSRDSLLPVDRFMLDLCQVPKLGMRIDLVLSLWDFPNNYEALAEEVEELLSACEVLLGSSSLPVVLHCLLAIGNHLNAKRQPKALQGFQISSIDKMVDLKGRDPDYTLMTFLVEQLQASRPDLLDWTLPMDPLLPRVAGYSVRAIGAEIDVLKNDLQKVRKYQKTLKGLGGVPKKFQSDVQNFLLENEKRMQTIHDKNHRLKQRFQQLLTPVRHHVVCPQAWLGEPTSRTSDVLFSSLVLLMERFHTARTRLAT